MSSPATLPNMDIIVKNLYSYLKGTAGDELKKVREYLSFRPSGYQFSPKYQSGQWDGTICLLNKWTGQFPTGLVGFLHTRLAKNGVKVRLLDVRKRPVGEPIKTSVEMRDYQEPAVVEALEIGRGILNLPTASGKTIVAGEIIGRAGVQTLFVNHTKDLLYQSKEALENVLGVEVGMIGEGTFRPRKVSVGMVQTLYSKLEDYSLKEYLRSVQMLVLDEVHHTGRNTWFDVAMSIPAYYRFGLTGTAKREDGANLNLIGATGRIISKITSSELVKKGYLAKPHIRVYPITKTISAFDYRDAYQKGIVECKERNEKVVDLAWEMMQKDETVLVLVTRVDHGKLLSDSIPGAEFLYGGKSGSIRKDALTRFKKRELQCIVATTIFDEGVDVPNLNAVIFAGGGESDIRTTQRVGRVLRPAPGKEFATVIDFYDKHDRYLWDHSDSRIAVYKSEPEFQLEFMEG